MVGRTRGKLPTGDAAAVGWRASSLMKTIVTAYGSYATGTELADAVTSYGLALARIRTVDVVDIPFVAAGGGIERVQLRVGWLSDMSTITVDGCADELLEDDTLLTLIEETAALGGRGVVFTEEDIEGLRSAPSDWDDVT
jgi:hypothetical protein